MSKPMELSPVEAAVIEQVAASRDVGLDLLDRLLAASRSGEAAMQTIVAAEFEALGYEIDLFEADLAALANHPEFSLVPELEAVGTRGRPNLIAALPGAPDAPALFAFAHIDSYELDPADWTTDPYRATVGADGLARGYGIADDRSGVVGMILAARALAAAGYRPKGRLTLSSCLGKHLGTAGTLAVMDRGIQADGAVYLHPAETGAGLTEYKAVSLGLLQFQLVVHGKSPGFREKNETPAAHLGTNAIERAIAICEQLGGWATSRADRIHHPLVDEALGQSTNLSLISIIGHPVIREIPERCTITGAITFPPGETVASLREDLTRAVNHAAARSLGCDLPVELTWLPLMANPAGSNPDAPFVVAFTDAVAAIAEAPPAIWPAHTASDIRYPMRYAGAPTVGFGPRAGNFGGPDEWLDLDDFERAVQSLALLIVRWCGVERLPGKDVGG